MSEPSKKKPATKSPEENDPQFDMPVEEAMRELLLETGKIPPLLAQALDRIPDAWEVLFLQMKLAVSGPPEELTRRATVGLNESERHLRLRHGMVTRNLSHLRRSGYDFDFKRGC